MPQIPSVSPATGQSVPNEYTHTTDGHFVDNNGRVLLLRGVNLSGSCKAPLDQPSQLHEGFWESAEESFVGRPLNLEDGSADVHLARLRGWGFNMIRYVVTWEAIEHEGPGKYDEEYMDYTVRVLRKCKEYGFKIFMDPHQDVWSRFSGGSGAPLWTLYACGLEPRNFTPTQAALLHCEHPSASSPDPASFPAMIWSTNYARLTSQTVWTMFFAGRSFAPKCIIDGQNIQDYLQSHYISAMGALAERISTAGDLADACVLGWDTLNEPSEGLCGWPDLNKPSEHQTAQLKKGTAPTPAQALRLGMGRAQTVETWSFSQFGPKKTGAVTVDPQGVRAWADPKTEPDGVHPRWGWRRDPGWALGTCVWAQHGVWDTASGDILVPDYFARATDFNADFWRPHVRAFAAGIRAAQAEAIVFINPPVFSVPPAFDAADTRGRCCYSAHYYDGLTLVSRHWNWFNADALGVMRGKYATMLQALRVGEGAIRRCLRDQLGYLKADVPAALGPFPTLIGEIGIPYDMDGKRAYGYTDDGKYKGDYSQQQRALDASLNGADGTNVLNYTIWTYCPDNEHQWGDGWNLEDLSIYSPDDLRGKELDMRLGTGPSEASTLAPGRRPWLGLGESGDNSMLSLATISVKDADYVKTVEPAGADEPWSNLYDFLTDGARAAKAFSRPYPMATVGVPTSIDFDIGKAEFKLVVTVHAEDAPASRGRSSTSSSSSSSGGDEDGELPTEIYLPLVHYASNESVGQSAANDQEDAGTASKAASNANLLSGREHVRQNSTSTLVSSPLALDVTVSAGRWEVEGQKLRWWYAVPRPGEPAAEYTITVKRSGGAIKTSEEAAHESSAGWMGMGEWCPTKCSQGCVLM